MKINSSTWWLGVAMTAMLAVLGNLLAGLSFFSIIGPMVLAILLGMGISSLLGQRNFYRTSELTGGYVFASKYLLRAGIILLGVRLDLLALADGGIQLLGTEILLVALTLIIGFWIARKCGVDTRLAVIVAAGTAICGAAAAVAIAVQVRARSEQTVIGVAIIAVLGTLFTVLYTLLYPVLALSAHDYGTFAGATLHEIAHVIAAATPFGEESLDTALLVKLSRVVLLAPVALIIGWWFTRKEKANSVEGTPSKVKLPIPYFVFGFLAVGALHTWQVIPASWTPLLLQTSLFLLTMGMAGLGLQVNIRALKGGGSAFASAAITSSLLAGAGYTIAQFFLL